MLKVRFEYDLPEYDPSKHDPDKVFGFLTYRGVEYNVNCAEQKDAHGTYCYRGRTYTK